MTTRVGCIYLFGILWVFEDVKFLALTITGNGESAYPGSQRSSPVQ
jgi:hypothetical protein